MIQTNSIRIIGLLTTLVTIVYSNTSEEQYPHYSTFLNEAKIIARISSIDTSLFRYPLG